MQHITSFNEANDYLISLYGNQQTKYSLDNIKELVGFLDNPQDKFKAIHIAGTSGKTSTAYFMASLLKAGNYKTGLTVSPIIDEVNERLQLDLKPLSETEFTSAITNFINLLSSSDIKPSHFEFLIAFAFWYFANQNIDYGVIEVGLGGLKDATNIMTREDKVCLITDIGYDHMNVLGYTLPEIAAQKAGIILPGNEVFMYAQAPEVMKAVETKVKQVGAKLNIVPESPNSNQDLPDYQHRNWSLACAAYEFLAKRDSLKRLTGEQLENSKHTQVPGRMDIKRFRDKIIILDGAHNTQKMTAFIDSFKKLYPNTKPAILIAMRTGKDYKEVAKQLSLVADKVITTTFKAYQDTPVISLPADKLAAAFKSTEVLSIENNREALEALIDSKEEVLVITGSLYLLSQLRHEASFLK